MRWLLLLAMLLLCALCAAQFQKDDKRTALRLCGRAFVRAVVYTCGGSRWRRQMGEDEEASTEGHRKNVPMLSRSWRDQNQALISECCTLGCQRSDLSMLC